MKKFYLCMLTAFSCLVLTTPAPLNAQVQTPRSITVTANSHGFYEYLPQGYSTGKSFPLILFLHGLGEVGDGKTKLSLILKHGPPKLISLGSFPKTFTVNGKTYSFIVISPQFVATPSVTDVQSYIDYAVKHYKVDVSRIYVTGLSMGGGAVWKYASANKDNANRIAAIVPIAGAASPSKTGPAILATADLPVWGFHNLNDDRIPSKYTVSWVAAINGCTPVPSPLARKTIFNAIGHNAWNTAYDPSYKENGLNVYQWLLQYSRGTAAPAPAPIVNAAPVANAGADKSILLPVNSVTLTGSGTDPDGTIASYKWSKISGPVQYTISNFAITNPLISNLAQGDYVFRLTVTDNKGSTAYNDVTVSVKPLSAPVVVTAPIAVPGTLQAESYSSMAGIQTEITTDAGGGLDVGWIDAKDWLSYTVNVAVAGTYNINYRVASENTGQQFQLLNAGGTVLGTYSIPNTGGWQTWKTVSAKVTLPAGTQTIKVYSPTQRWNLNWIQFTPAFSTIAIPGTVQAETYSSMYGVQKDDALDTGGGLDVGWIDAKDWMAYTVNVASAATYNISYRVATANSGQQFQLLKSDGTVLGTYSIPVTGGYHTWKTVTATVKLSAGVQTIKVYSTTQRWNLNWIQFAVGAAAKSVDEEFTTDTVTLTAVKSIDDSIITGTINSEPQKVKLTTLDKKAVFAVYPNPVNNVLNAQLKNKYYGAVKIKITDAAGRVRKEVNTTKNFEVSQLSIPVQELNPGVYFMTVEIGSWKETRQVLKL